MAGRQVVAVIMAFGLEFCRIHAISSAVRAGEARVAVKPEARTPKKIGAKGKQLGSWISITGAISGPSGHDGVGGSLRTSEGFRPRASRPDAMASESREI